MMSMPVYHIYPKYTCTVNLFQTKLTWFKSLLLEGLFSLCFLVCEHPHHKNCSENVEKSQ